MRIELCKFAGGTCDLCKEGTVCHRQPPVDFKTASGFIEDHRRSLSFPTCDAYEGNWLRIMSLVKALIPGGNNAWHAITRDDKILLDVHPRVTFDVSRWFGAGVHTVTATLLEKNPLNIQDYFSFGAQNGLTVCHGVPFAVSTRGSLLVTRPVVRARRQQVLHEYCEFEAKFGSMYNA